jgi:hypothetical protein
MGKIQIQQFCNQYTMNVTRDISRSMNSPESEIVELLSVVETTGDRGHIQALKRKKATLADLLGLRAQGALVRSKFQEISEMHASSKFFFGLEKKNGQRRIIHCLKSADRSSLAQMKLKRGWKSYMLSSTSVSTKRAEELYAGLYKYEYKEGRRVLCWALQV